MIEDLSSSPPHSITINAHQNELECIALNQSGTMLATASQKGPVMTHTCDMTSKWQLYQSSKVLFDDLFGKDFDFIS